MHTSFEMFSLEFFALQDSSSAAASQFPEKLQHRYNRDDDARQRRPHGDNADSLFLEGIEPLAKRIELRLHPIAPVLLVQDDSNLRPIG